MSRLYFDLKRILTNKITLAILLLLLAIMISDPFLIYLHAYKYPGFFENIGSNPFQFWLLINSAGVGNKIYNVVFWILPIFFSTIIFCFEQRSSIEMLSMIRESKTKYYIYKITASFLSTFLLFTVLFLINLFITYCIFPNRDLFSEQYHFYIPNEGTFGYLLYSIDPFVMAMVYGLINSLALAIISVFYFTINMLIKFKNQYVAIVAPIISLYSTSFIFDSFTSLYRYNLRLIIQPNSANALTQIIGLEDVIFTLLGWIILDLILIIIGIIRNRDVV